MKLISIHLKGLAHFAGREARSSFWPWAGITILLYTFLSFAASAVLLAMMPIDNPAGVQSTFSQLAVANGVACVVILAMLAAAVVRRLHDSNRSGWWAWLPVPNLAVGVVLVGSQFGLAEDAEILSTDPILFLMLNNMIYIALLIVLIVLCAQPGTPGDNRFGPPPA